MTERAFVFRDRCQQNNTLQFLVVDLRLDVVDRESEGNIIVYCIVLYCILLYFTIGSVFTASTLDTKESYYYIIFGFVFYYQFLLFKYFFCHIFVVL